MLIYISTFRNIRQTFTLLYTFRYRFQGLISQKVDKIRPPDQHVSDQQHEKENRKRWNLKWNAIKSEIGIEIAEFNSILAHLS